MPSEPANYRLELRGNVSSKLLRPLLDDFTTQPSEDEITDLVGFVRDPAHLHGVVAHLTSMNITIISVASLGPTASDQRDDA